MDSPETPAQPPPSQSIPAAQWLRLLIILSTFLLLLFTVGVVVRLLSGISHTLLLFSLGGLIAYALSPLVERVRGSDRKGKRPRWVGVAVVFMCLFAITVLGGTLLGNTLAGQVSVLVRNREQYQREGRAFIARTDSLLSARGLNAHVQEYIEHPPPNVVKWEKQVAQGAFEGAQHFSASLVESAIVLLIAMYFLIYSGEMRLNINRNLPEMARPYAEQWQSDMNRILGGFVRGQVVLAVVMGVAAALGCALLGVSYWLLVGLLVTFASLIPVFGPYIGAVPAVIAAAISPSGHVLTPLVRIVLVILLFFVINEAGSKILYPRLVGSALGLHEVVMLFVLFAGLEVGGIWGVLFAAPVTAMGIVTAVQLYRLWHGLTPVSLASEAAVEGKAAREQGTP